MCTALECWNQGEERVMVMVMFELLFSEIRADVG